MRLDKNVSSGGAIYMKLVLAGQIYCNGGVTSPSNFCVLNVSYNITQCFFKVYGNLVSENLYWKLVRLTLTFITICLVLYHLN